MRRVASWLVWWVGLWWLWMLAVGEWNEIEFRAAACAATVAASFAELLRSFGLLRSFLPWRWVGRAWSSLFVVFADFGLVMWVLACRLAGRYGEGVFRERPSEAARAGVGVRAWATMTATYSPNAYVVGWNEDDGSVLLHTLVEWDQSEKPA